MIPKLIALCNIVDIISIIKISGKKQMKKTIKQLFTLLFTLMVVITASINVKADNEIVKEDTYYIPYYPKVKAFKIPPEPVSSSYDQKIVALGISNKSIATISSKKNSDGQYVVYSCT